MEGVFFTNLRNNLNANDLISGPGRRHQYAEICRDISTPKIGRHQHAKKGGDISTPEAVIDILLIVLEAAL